MDRISINLLPPQLKENKQFESKKKLIYRISIAFLLVLILLTAGLIVMTVIQKSQLQKEVAKTASLTGKIDSLRENEAAVMILKNRLNTITQISGKQYSQTDSFILVTSLLPPNVNMQSFTVDQRNSVSLQGNAETASDLQKFFDNLSDPTVNEGKITKTTISSLNRGPSSRMVFDLEISTNFSGVIKK